MAMDIGPPRPMPTPKLRLTELESLELAPGDVLIVRCPDHLLPNEVEELHGRIGVALPGRAVLILDRNATLSVLKTERVE